MDNGYFSIRVDMSPEELAEMVAREFQIFLESFATPKERHLMRHAKRWRVRKKYTTRVIRRLLERDLWQQLKDGGRHV